MAKGFKAIGFSCSTEKKIKKKIGINLNTYTLKTNQNNKIYLTDSRRNAFDNQFKTNYPAINQDNVKAIAIDNIKFHVKMWSYKGYRHNYKFPVRGQRTHTNRRTAKKLNLYGYDN